MQDKRTRLVCILLTICFYVILANGPVNAKPVFRLVYVVQEGNSLSNIAQKFGVSVYLLKQANCLTDKSVLKAGNELYIPLKGESYEFKKLVDTKLFQNSEPPFQLSAGKQYRVRIKPEPPKIKIPKERLTYYKVKKGDTFYSLAKKFKTSVAIIKGLNQTEAVSLKIGQKMLVPALPAPPAPKKNTPVWVYRKGKIKATQEDINLLARVVQAESSSEPYLGKVAVASVILNRVTSGKFPGTIKGVLYAPGQFHTVRDGMLGSRPSATTYRAVQEALSGKDPTGGALYFINPKRSGSISWFTHRSKTVTIGNHTFAK